LAKATAFVSQYKFGDGKLSVAHLGALIPVGAGQIRVSYMRADASGRTVTGTSIDADDAAQIALGYVYNLSKRTALYGTAARVDNKGRAAYALQATPALPSPNVQSKDSRGFELGVRHTF
jgi:predicted porin